MSIMDANMEMDDGRSLATFTVSSFASASVVDLGVADRNVGQGEPIWAHVRIGTALVGDAGTATLDVRIQHANTNAAASFVDLIKCASGAATSTYRSAGTKIIEQPLPNETKRYIRTKYIVGTTTFSAGTVDSFLDLSSQNAR